MFFTQTHGMYEELTSRIWIFFFFPSFPKDVKRQTLDLLQQRINHDSLFVRACWHRVYNALLAS